MRSDQSTQNNKFESCKDHSSLKPSKAGFPLLGEKLDYLYAQIGITQQYLADQIGVESCAISQWKTNGIPKIRLIPLCKCLGIGRTELEIADMSVFREAVQKRYSNDVGARWRLHAQQRSVTGLELDVLAPAVGNNPKFKAIYRKPQSVSAVMHMPRVAVNDSVRFKLPVSRAELPDQEEIEALLLIVEDPAGLQLLTPETQDPQMLLDRGFYSLPIDGSTPFYIGLPTGKYCAYLVLLAANPPAELWRIFAEKPDGYAADALASWLIGKRIVHKINAIEFQVNV